MEAKRRDDLMTREEAAKYLGVTAAWLRKRVTQGGPASIKLGATRYYLKADLDRYIAACRHEPAAAECVQWESTSAVQFGGTASHTKAKSTEELRAKPTSAELRKRSAAYGLR